MRRKQIATVAGLWRYPVKSMRGERLDEMALTRRGAIGDRLDAGMADLDELLVRKLRFQGLHEACGRLARGVGDDVQLDRCRCGGHAAI